MDSIIPMIDTNLIDDVIVSGIDMKDYPDFCDAFIDSAIWIESGKQLTESEIDELNQDSEYVYDKAYQEAVER